MSAIRALVMLVEIGPVAFEALSIPTTTLPNATQGDPYIATVVGDGGVLPYAWSITVGALPSGLVIDDVTGEISGTSADSADTYPFTVLLTDALGDTVVRDLTLTLQAP